MIKSIDDQQVDLLYDLFNELKGTLQDYSITLQQHNLNEQNARVIQQTSKIEEAKRILYNLSDRAPIQLNITGEDKRAYKTYGYVEASYFHTFGTKIKINNFSEFENATQEINKRITEELES